MINCRGFLSFIAIFYFSHVVAQNTIEFSDIEKEWIKEHQTVHFGYDANWPPFEMYNDGEYTGIVADYVKLIEEYTGIEMIPEPQLNYSKTLEKLENGEIHVAPMVGYTDARNEFLDYTNVYLSDPQVIVTRNNYEFIEGIGDLRGKTITQPKGYKRISRIKNEFPDINIKLTNDVEESLLAVSTSRVEAFVGSLSVVSYYINDLGISNLKIAAPAHLGNIKFRLAVTKDWVVFRDITQKVFDNLTKSHHSTIRNNWITIRYEHGIDSKQLRNYIVYGLVSILLMFSFFYLWNITLRKQIRIRKKVEEDLKKSLELINDKNIEKDTLLKEIHHRVKNNLQIVYSMLNMQSRQVDNKSARKVLSEGKSRVMAMALIHKVLYESENIDKVDLTDYLNSLLRNIKNVYNNEDRNVEVNVMVKDILLNLDLAIPLGLILNELLTNSYKHAFIDKDSGCIFISIEKKNGLYCFAYKDNGIGLDNVNIESYKSLGMRLVSRLASQINAKAILKSDSGVEVTFNFK